MVNIAKLPPQSILNRFIDENLPSTPEKYLILTPKIHNYFIDGRIVQVLTHRYGEPENLLVFCINKPAEIFAGSGFAYFDDDIEQWVFEDDISGIEMYQYTDIVKQISPPYNLFFECNAYCQFHKQEEDYYCYVCMANSLICKTFSKCNDCNKYLCRECFSERDQILEDDDVHNINGLHNRYDIVSCGCKIYARYTIHNNRRLKIPEHIFNKKRFRYNTFRIPNKWYRDFDEYEEESSNQLIDQSA